MFTTARFTRLGSTPLVAHSVTPLVHAVTRWPVESQQRARRNAMIASTALAQRRAEIDDVEEFLASLGGLPAAEVAAQAAHG
ncbi:hypothetical protein H5V45_04975 [Nocardioides sp. KIGAM211]|uniref:Uncharacterized protein n=1 Tax=Nocardioides luti TaxID=2761101 RepID=A0A7X0RE84_9ACTN|nr:hypothetical protein [Nocardioides luti]MBB6626671.1 hypothetical protein [Nocardioides luti]